MSVIPFPQRHTRGEPDLPCSSGGQRPHGSAGITGTFQSPSGRAGTMSGWLRANRFVMDSGRLWVAGVFTGELRDADGSPIGIGSRRGTAPAEISCGDRGDMAVVGPVEVNLLGLSVSVAAVTMEVGALHAPASCSDTPDSQRARASHARR